MQSYIQIHQLWWQRHIPGKTWNRYSILFSCKVWVRTVYCIFITRNESLSGRLLEIRKLNADQEKRQCHVDILLNCNENKIEYGWVSSMGKYILPVHLRFVQVHNQLCGSDTLHLCPWTFWIIMTIILGFVFVIIAGYFLFTTATFNVPASLCSSIKSNTL